MINITDIKTGDILLYKGKKPISKAIMAFMKVFGKEIDKKSNWIPSHTGTFIWIGETLMIAESIEKGFKIHNFTDSYDLSKDDYKILTPVYPYNQSELELLKAKAFDLAFKSIAYGYLSLGAWAVKVISLNKVNLFRDNEDFTICYESTCRIGIAGRASNWSNIKNVECVSIYDYLENNNYKTHE